MKKLFKIYIGIFIFFVIFSLGIMGTNAADIIFDPQVDIGSYKGENITGTSIGNYIKAIYVYAISAVGILAAFMIMFNGFNWVISAGNQEKIKEAQSKIAAALSGLVLVLFAYALFNFINPDLVNLKSIEPKLIPPSSASGCCVKTDKTGFTASSEAECKQTETNTFTLRYEWDGTKCITTAPTCCLVTYNDWQWCKDIPSAMEMACKLFSVSKNQPNSWEMKSGKCNQNPEYNLAKCE